MTCFYRGYTVFKFLFGEKNKASVVTETKRQKLKRALAEVNEVLDALDPKPKIAVDLASGRIEIADPEQFPDEARALPAPDTGAKQAGAAPVGTAPAQTAPAAVKPQPAPGPTGVAEPTKLQPRVPEPRVPTPKPPKPVVPEAKTSAKADN